MVAIWNFGEAWDDIDTILGTPFTGRTVGESAELTLSSSTSDFKF